MIKKTNKIVYSWCLYDWANSAFATTIMAAVLPTFYSSVAGSGLDKTVMSSYWGYTNTIAMLAAALLAPILGAISDLKNSKKYFLGIFTSLGVVSTSLMVLISSGNWFFASILFIFGRIGFAGSNIFYSSLLPHITNQDNLDKVSTRGYACGYLGGGILLLVNLLMIMKPNIFFIPNSEWGARLSFLSVGLWWGIFSIPLFRFVPEPYIQKTTDRNINPVTMGFKTLRSTFKEIQKYKQLLKFLISYWLYNDGIGTIIVMAVVYGTEIGINQNHLIGAILLVQFFGIPFTILFGKLSKTIGTKNSIQASLFIYTIISILGYFMRTSIHFWILAILVGIVQGGAQALSRSMFASMIPHAKSGEFFGFYEVSGKFAGILGPAIFGLAGQITGSSRYGILVLVLFFVSGSMLLQTVKLQKHGNIEKD